MSNLVRSYSSVVKYFLIFSSCPSRSVGKSVFTGADVKAMGMSCLLLPKVLSVAGGPLFGFPGNIMVQILYPLSHTNRRSSLWCGNWDSNISQIPLQIFSGGSPGRDILRSFETQSSTYRVEVPEDLLTVCGQLNFSAWRDWLLFNGSSAINFPSTAVLKST
jgi:hypothetical protein